MELFVALMPDVREDSGMDLRYVLRSTLGLGGSFFFAKMVIDSGPQSEAWPRKSDRSRFLTPSSEESPCRLLDFGSIVAADSVGSGCCSVCSERSAHGLCSVGTGRR